MLQVVVLTALTSAMLYYALSCFYEFYHMEPIPATTGGNKTRK